MTAARIHGGFYVASGMWPVVHYRSFEAATGPKVDGWLVKTLGGVIAVVGLALLAGDERRRATKLLGVGTALVLATADLVYTLRGRVSKVYLADAAVELGLIGLWTIRNRRL
jgi:hypothetical protein